MSRHKKRHRRPFTEQEREARKLQRLLKLPEKWLAALRRTGQL